MLYVLIIFCLFKNINNLLYNFYLKKNIVYNIYIYFIFYICMCIFKECKSLKLLKFEYFDCNNILNNS